MTRQIHLTVLPERYTDPMELLQLDTASRRELATYQRDFPLFCDPPPDTLFMRATEIDLGVFGEDLPDGDLQMIDAGHSREMLEQALEADLANTVAALVAFSRDAVTAAEVSAAIRSGEWADDPDRRRAAILQAAGFARQLVLAIRAARTDEAVVWEYTGGRCTYDYR